MKTALLVLIVMVGCSKMNQDSPYTLAPSFNVDFEVVNAGQKSLETEDSAYAVRVAGNLTQVDYLNVIKASINKVGPATIRLVDSRESGNIGEIGVATASGEKISIVYSAEYLAQWGESIAKLYDEAKRKNIFSEISSLRQKASTEAEGKDFLYEEQLLKKYYEELKIKYKINEGHLLELDREALDKSWV